MQREPAPRRGLGHGRRRAAPRRHRALGGAGRCRGRIVHLLGARRNRPGGRLAARSTGSASTWTTSTSTCTFADPFEWPKAFGGGGIFSSVPFLNQYWQPYRLGGKASGTVEFGGETWSFDGATLYAERNWGAGFPERWWWGQAHDFDGADVSVAFSGGLLELGPMRRDVTGVVVRLGNRVIRITPPAPVRSHVTDGRWTVSGHARRATRSTCDGDGTGPRSARAASAAARRATQRRHRLRASCRSTSLHRARIRPGGVRRHVRAGRSGNRQAGQPRRSPSAQDRAVTLRCQVVKPLLHDLAHARIETP